MVLGMTLKIGFFLYLIFVSHTIDTLGRLRAFTIGMIVQILTLCAVIASPQDPHGDSPLSLYILYLSVTFNSVAYHLLNYSGWIYFLEMLPSKYHSLAIILSNVGKSSAMIFGALFFLSGASSDINYLLLVNTGIVCLMLLVITVYFPESPKYHFIVGKYQEARQVI